MDTKQKWKKQVVKIALSVLALAVLFAGAQLSAVVFRMDIPERDPAACEAGGRYTG